MVDITGGDVTLTVIALLWLAAILSMIVDNIPAVTTLIPLSVAVGRGLFPELSDMPVEEFVLTPEMLPVWWSLALGADLGGNGTLVGASANVVGAGLSERHGERITFMEFTRQGMPITLLTLVVSDRLRVPRLPAVERPQPIQNRLVLAFGETTASQRQQSPGWVLHVCCP
ncbi:MAG: hypothetical protein R2849_14575 [Thermomicrobiales bacterium]